MMELSVKMNNGSNLLVTFEKSSIIDLWQSPKYDPRNIKDQVEQ